MLKLAGVILGMVFVVACVVAAGMTLVSYFINKNNKCSCVKRWERIKKLIMDFLIILGIILGTFLLGRFALLEAYKIESQKKFKKNVDKYNEKKGYVESSKRNK